MRGTGDGVHIVEIPGGHGPGFDIAAPRLRSSAECNVNAWVVAPTFKSRLEEGRRGDW